VRLLGYWHRVFYTGDADAQDDYAMPPGALRVRDGGVDILPGGRRMSWAPQHTPALFKKPKL
jgi:hypothetical protein